MPTYSAPTTPSPETAALFIDGGAASKFWQSLHRNDNLDFAKLRNILEKYVLDPATGDSIIEAYYFNGRRDDMNAKQTGFYTALSSPPPNGAGLRVKLYDLKENALVWPKSNGSEPVLHPVTREPYVHTVQHAVDVGIVFYMMRSFNNCRWKTLFLQAGDGDIAEPVQHLVENENVKLVLISMSGMTSGKLSSYAREFVDVAQCADYFARPKPIASQPQLSASSKWGWIDTSKKLLLMR